MQLITAYTEINTIYIKDFKKQKTFKLNNLKIKTSL